MEPCIAIAQAHHLFGKTRLPRDDADLSRLRNWHINDAQASQRVDICKHVRGDENMILQAAKVVAPGSAPQARKVRAGFGPVRHTASTISVHSIGKTWKC